MVFDTSPKLGFKVPMGWVELMTRQSFEGDKSLILF